MQASRGIRSILQPLQGLQGMQPTRKKSPCVAQTVVCSCSHRQAWQTTQAVKCKLPALLEEEEEALPVPKACRAAPWYIEEGEEHLGGTEDALLEWLENSQHPAKEEGSQRQEGGSKCPRTQCHCEAVWVGDAHTKMPSPPMGCLRGPLVLCGVLLDLTVS